MSSAPDLVTSPLRSRVTHGLLYPLRGVRMMISTPSLWPYVIVPILVTAGFILGALWVSWSWGGALAQDLLPMPTGTGWVAWAGRGMWTVSKAVIHVALFAVLAVLGWFAGGLVASPFYDRLSDRVERIVRGQGVDEAFDARVVLQDVVTGVLHSLGSLALYLGVSCPLLLLHLVPALGEPIYVLASGTVTSFFLAREVLDYSLSRRRVPFVDKFRLVWSHRAVTGGLGFGTFLLVWVPLLNFLSMPASVIGGTLLFCELQAQGLIDADAPSTP